MVRQKVIHKMKAYRISKRHLLVYILSSAGTYIKEFVHGDLERTLPNLGSLLQKELDIFQLDVVDLYDRLDEDALVQFEAVAKFPPELMLT